MKLSAKDRLIVALDVDSKEKALSLVDELKPFVGLFKIGSQLFTSAGPNLVSEVIRRGSKVFLDLKYHDIPNTVASAVAAATRLGVSICNVHALGGFEMMRQVREECEKVSAQEKLPKPILLAVTVLTSHDQNSINDLGIDETLNELVVRLAKLTAKAGLDGVVASAHEIALVRNAVNSPFIVLTPGLRPSWTSNQDQKRVMTPEQALADGADYLVIGRPILADPSPANAAQKILDSLEKSPVLAKN
ncbi:MAG: orotidine-5'-phosphate decarboxylase [Acidobacteria bacterium]|nr:orotidine-5'-phosphate decarboxylase [Acidobacteriota bacterium]